MSPPPLNEKHHLRLRLAALAPLRNVQQDLQRRLGAAAVEESSNSGSGAALPRSPEIAIRSRDGWRTALERFRIPPRDAQEDARVRKAAEVTEAAVHIQVQLSCAVFMRRVVLADRCHIRIVPRASTSSVCQRHRDSSRHRRCVATMPRVSCGKLCSVEICTVVTHTYDDCTLLPFPFVLSEGPRHSEPRTTSEKTQGCLDSKCAYRSISIVALKNEVSCNPTTVLEDNKRFLVKMAPKSGRTRWVRVKPTPVPVKTRTRRHGHGISRAGVRVAQKKNQGRS